MLWAIYLKFESQNFIEIVPILGALALGAQRLLPVMQMVYSSLSLVRGHAEQVTEIINTLALRSSDSKDVVDENISFSNVIRFENVSLNFGNDKKRKSLEMLILKLQNPLKLLFMGKQVLESPVL